MHGPKKGQLSIMYIINEGKRKKRENYVYIGITENTRPSMT